MDEANGLLPEDKLTMFCEVMSPNAFSITAYLL